MLGESLLEGAEELSVLSGADHALQERGRQILKSHLLLVKSLPLSSFSLKSLDGLFVHFAADCSVWHAADQDGLRTAFV